jgi:hypothetical protein
MFAPFCNIVPGREEVWSSISLNRRYEPTIAVVIDRPSGHPAGQSDEAHQLVSLLTR